MRDIASISKEYRRVSWILLTGGSSTIFRRIESMVMMYIKTPGARDGLEGCCIFVRYMILRLKEAAMGIY